MTFYIEDHGKPVLTFEAKSHKEALDSFRQTYPPDSQVVLRDWQLYKVNEETLNQCISNTNIVWLMFNKVPRKLTKENINE